MMFKRIWRMLVKLKLTLRDFASRNFFYMLLAEIVIYTIWSLPLGFSLLLPEEAEPIGIGLFAVSTALGIWLFNGLDERRLKDFPEEMLRLEWFRLN